ncbi:MAG: hypothetical protein LBR44_09760 [Clostridiales Family XIII bacterium]|nr:hypothetical protein [Clostridiales Family XIII bacterium]
MAVLLVLVIGFGFSFGGLLGGGSYNNHITSIEVQTQMTNGAMSTTYIPVVEDGFDWAGASDSTRVKIARYGVKEALKKQAVEQPNIYFVMGLASNRTDTLFLYTGSGKIQIIVNGKVTEEVEP